jgi:hypothetical protein
MIDDKIWIIIVFMKKSNFIGLEDKEKKRQVQFLDIKISMENRANN